VIENTLAEAVIKLAKDGVISANNTKFHSGEALDWNRKNYSERRVLMTSVVKSSLLGRAGTKSKDEHKEFLIVNNTFNPSAH